MLKLAKWPKKCSTAYEERPSDEKIEDYAAKLGVTCKEISLRRHGALFGTFPGDRPWNPTKAQLDRVMNCLGYAPWRVVSVFAVQV